MGLRFLRCRAKISVGSNYHNKHNLYRTSEFDEVVRLRLRTLMLMRSYKTYFSVWRYSSLLKEPVKKISLEEPIFRSANDPSCSHFLISFTSNNRLFSNSNSSIMSSSVNNVREVTLPPLNVDSDQDVKNSPELERAVSACSTCLINGGVIGVPTDTIYGIAGLSQNIDAVNRIYDIKQRNYEKPLAISVGGVDDIYRWSKVTVPRDLLTDLLPGPVTVVFERSPELNPNLNPHTSKIGIRIPGYVFMQELARRCGGPIALTSANISGGRSCLQIEEFQYLWPQLDLVVNGGVLNDTEESRLGSTVVDLSIAGSFRIIRNGSAYFPTCKVLQDKYNLKNTTSLPQDEV